MPMRRFTLSGSVRGSLRESSLFYTLLALGIGVALVILPLPWAFILLTGCILTIGVLLRPALAYPLLALSIPFGSLREIPIGPAKVGITELLLGLLAAVWLARKVALRERWRGPGPLWGFFLIFYGVILFSTLQALSLGYALKELIKWGEVFLLYLIVYTTLREGEIPWVIGGLLLAGAAEALVGIYQFFTQTGPEHFIILGRFMRAYGHFMQPNPFGGYMGLAMPLAAGWGIGWVMERLGQEENARAFAWLGWAMMGFIAAALTGAALVMSWSRGAWLGAAAALAVVGSLYSRRVAFASLAAVALLGTLIVLSGVGVVPAAVAQRFQDIPAFFGMVDVRTVEITDENYALVERLAHWDAAIRMWSDHLWLGVGIGNYEPVYPAYALPRWPEPLGHSHNYYLNIAAEAGLVGLVSYLLLWGAIFFYTWRAIRRNRGWKRGLAVGIMGVFTHLSVHNLFDNLYVHGMYLHIAVLLGITGVLFFDDGSAVVEK